MKKKILSKIFAQKNKKVTKTEVLKFGEDTVINLKDNYQMSFLLRKRLEFKKKDFGHKLIIEYYSNTIEAENAHIVFRYTTRKKPRMRNQKYDFLITGGTHKLEFTIPVNMVQLNVIEIYMTKKDNVDGLYILRFDNIYFSD